MKIGVAAAGVLMCAGGALAQWSDDFNRPNGPIGGDWTVVSGTWGIVGNQGAHQSAPANEIIQHNLASLAYGASVSSLDVFQNGTVSQFSGLLIGLGGTDTIMVKIQDQVAGANFSNIGIYHKISATGWGQWTGTTTLPGGGTSTAGFFAIPAGLEFGAARIFVSFPTADLLQLDIDVGINGSIDQTYTRSGVSTMAANLGMAHGISAWGTTAVFDNWSVTVIPAPGVAALLGFAGLFASRRRRA